MKFPKQVFKATWLVFSITQVALLILYAFNIGLVRILLWWQLLTPLLWLAFWAALWLLTWLATAAWHSFLQAGREGSLKRDRHTLMRLRNELHAVEKVDRMSGSARELRAKIRELEKQMATRAGTGPNTP